MTPRQRMQAFFDGKPVDRIPNGLGACETAGLHNVAYHKLKRVLGVDDPGNRVCTFMNNAIFEPAVITAMEGDMILLGSRMCPSRFWGPQAAKEWKPLHIWDIDLQVAKDWQFRHDPDGSWWWGGNVCRPGSFYFDPPAGHGVCRGRRTGAAHTMVARERAGMVRQAAVAVRVQLRAQHDRQIELSDIVSFHFYGDYAGMKSRIAEFKKFGRPVVCTEWMARTLGGKWDTDLPLLKEAGVGCCNWGLVLGRTQTCYPWGSPKDTPEPAVWFHDLLRRDGSPKNPDEIAFIRGKAEGPYVDIKPDGPLTAEIDASLFRDDDGKVYFVHQNGKIARMKDDMTGLAGEPTLLTPANAGQVGFEGAFLFKANNRYYLSCAEFVDDRYHCCVASSKEVYGPYGDRYLAVPHGGHNMFFKDAADGFTGEKKNIQHPISNTEHPIMKCSGSRGISNIQYPTRNIQ